MCMLDLSFSNCLANATIKRDFKSWAVYRDNLKAKEDVVLHQRRRIPQLLATKLRSLARETAESGLALFHALVPGVDPKMAWLNRETFDPKRHFQTLRSTRASMGFTS
jgi:hypothetical protein